MKLPTLYKKTSTGAIQQWTIWTVKNAIHVEHGQVGGKLQLTTPDIIKEGKNKGRANATTAVEQAEAEAQSQWEKKLKKDYVKTIEAAHGGESSELIEGGILPMLAKRYDEQGDKIKWPAFAQPKLDGHRCIAMVANGKCTLWSRTRKRINSMPHIEQAVEALELKNVILDGELFNPEYRNNFEQLTHFIRQMTPREPGYEIVHYHCYDVAMPGTFTERNAFLRKLFQNVPSTSPLVLVETLPVQDEEELMLAFETWLGQGQEGAMVRNAEGLYVNKRSSDLLKVKEFADSEFKIVAIEEGRGKLAGHGIFVCETKSGTQFKAKMVGDTAALKQYCARPQDYIGKMLTVKYQGLTSAGIPRFPVALRIAATL